MWLGNNEEWIPESLGLFQGYSDGTGSTLVMSSNYSASRSSPAGTTQFPENTQMKPTFAAQPIIKFHGGQLRQGGWTGQTCREEDGQRRSMKTRDRGSSFHS